MQSLSVEAQAKLEKDTAKKEAKADAKAKAEAEKKQASASSSTSLGSFFVRLQTLMEEWRGPCLVHGHVAFAVTSANVWQACQCWCALRFQDVGLGSHYSPAGQMICISLSCARLIPSRCLYSPSYLYRRQEPLSAHSADRVGWATQKERSACRGWVGEA